MKLIYSLMIIIGTILNQINSLPIYSKHITNQNPVNPNLDPAIVVTRPSKPIILVDQQLTTIPIDDVIMPAKLILPSGEIIYTPQDIKPFIVSPFSDLEPVVIKPVEN
jgi:hypothetical protein